VGDSRFGGIARIILGLGRISRAEGWEVDVLATNPTVQAAVRSEGLGVVDLDVIRRPIRPLWDLAGAYRFYRFLRSNPYTVVHTHTSKGGFVGRFSAWLARVPVIIHTVHGFAFHEGSSPLALRAYTHLERLASQWCDRIVSVSEFHWRWGLDLRICSPSKILAIPNGITPVPPDPSRSVAEIRRKLGTRADDFLVFSTARLALDKGLDFLLRAVSILAKTDRHYQFAIAGDGPARAALEEFTASLGVSDMVTFLGFREDIADLLTACDLVALPSLREGMSISMLEAMAAGKPIVASSIGSNRELAAQANMAWLVPPANAEALAEAIGELKQRPDLRDGLASEARALFQERYTEERMLESYRRVYLELIREKCPTYVPQAPRAAHVRAAAHSDVRPAATDDLPGIVTIHQKAFRGFFLTRMGAEFLRRYYALVLEYHAGIVLVAGGQRALDGFVCGFVDPAEFYRRMWRSRSNFVGPAIGALLRDPSLAARMLYGVQRVQDSASRAQPSACELSSIAVAPDAAHHGIGSSLVEAFLLHSWSMDAQCVYLTTDADANERANTLYCDAGFRRARRFQQQQGRWMNEYVIERDACPEGRQ
jgi:glycosyltransferase involved in cell wall biosynthesis/ribosomal protein S18 acetylase RimI-like enzyme